jgi:oligogalacturonide lyase
VAQDGLYAAFVEREGGNSRLRLLDMRKGTAETIAEADEEISEPIVRPRRAGVLYRRGAGALWLASYDGRQNYRLRTAAGGLGPALWSPDGRAVLYLHVPEDPHQLRDIRELIPDTNEERQVAPTSQYAEFDCNGNASVFVGASASKASPYILILLRDVKREMTLCEHRASDAARVAPIFSPNSQHIYFQSDRDGKWAIYAIGVDRFVEKTES